MQIAKKTRLGIVALICTIVVAIFSAIPLFNRENDALILTLFFSAMGAGVALVHLINDLKNKEKKE